MGVEQQELKGFRRWARLEIMGHRCLAGLVSEVAIAGVGFIQIQVPGIQGTEGEEPTQIYGPQSIFCITPTTEEQAREYVAQNIWAVRDALGLPQENDGEVPY